MVVSGCLRMHGEKFGKFGLVGAAVDWHRTKILEINRGFNAGFNSLQRGRSSGRGRLLLSVAEFESLFCQRICGIEFRGVPVDRNRFVR